jgi:multiple sugar transport system permease protein
LRDGAAGFLSEGRKKCLFRHKKSVLLFLLPGLLGLIVFYLAPFLGGVYYSMTDGTFQNRFIWFQNYVDIWNNEMFLLGLKNTMELSLLCAPAIWVMSFLLSVMLKTLQGGGKFFRNALLLPYLVPSSALLLIWLLMFDYGGVINRLLVSVGLSRILWLEGGALRVPVVALYVWKNLGFSVVIFSAALQTVPDAYYEFASLEGANAWQRETKITLPLLAPTSFVVFLLAWVNAFKIFKEAYFIGGAYPDETVYTLQHFMNNKFAQFDYQDVTTAAYSFAVIVFVLFGLMYKTKSVRSPNQA